MNPSRNALSRPLVRLAAFAFISLFIAAPTPGNVGGCGGDRARTRITGDDAGNSAEFEFFDKGLCAHFCERLLNCGVLCPAIGAPGGCDQGNQLNASFVQCVRGHLTPGFFGGATACPHSCPGNTRFTLAYEWDAQACGDSVMTRSCVQYSESAANGIGNTFSNASSECLNDAICQPR